VVTPCDPAPTVLVVPDGASEPLRGDTATSLELAATPVWDRLAAQGRALAVATVPRRLPPGTEVGLPMLLGVSVSMAPARGRIEAAAAGVELAAGQAAWRVDAHPPRTLPAAAVAAVHQAVAPWGGAVYALTGHRMLLVGPAQWGDAPSGPHQADAELADIAGGVWRELAQACSAALGRAGVDAAAWPWGRAGGADELPDLPARDGRPRQVVSGGGAAPGLARLLGCELMAAEPADAAKVVMAAPAAAVVVVHDPRPDEAAHARDAGAKIDALATFDREVLAGVADAAADRGARLIVCPDHGCDPATGRHTADPVPAVVWRAGQGGLASVRTATERGVAGMGPVPGGQLMTDPQTAQQPGGRP